MAQHKQHTRQAWVKAGVIVFIIAFVAGGLIYWKLVSHRVYIDTSSIEGTQIDLAPAQAGTLQEVYVQEGDVVNANTTVARVGNELINTKVAGIITIIDQKIGAQVNPGTPVVSMVDPSTLRVVGKIDEDKGLSSIQVGDQVTFTVDAFGGKTYSGVLDEISPTSNQSGVIFNISDKREVKQFDVKVRFDTTAYPELKNGMSARIWIFTR